MDRYEGFVEQECLDISVKDRYQARKLCIEALYIYQYSQISCSSLSSLKWLTGTNLPKPGVMKYYSFLIEGVLAHKEELDILIKELAPKYSKDQIFKIDIAILELGLFTLRYEEKIPSLVVIDECIKLAKEYSGVGAHKFINGVLDAAYRQKVRRVEES